MVSVFLLMPIVKIGLEAILGLSVVIEQSMAMIILISSHAAALKDKKEMETWSLTKLNQ